MFKVKVMFDRTEGYRTVYYGTLKQVKEFIRGCKAYQNPIDIYYSIVY